MRIDDLLDMDQLALDIENGYVTERYHPDNSDLRILNYADKCQYEPYWTEVTRKTRGLIYDAYSLEIVARPFEKFFNYGQEAGVEFDLDSVVAAFDKMDGSLGVAYWDGKKFAIATRGSFESDQAIHATEWLHKEENYKVLNFIAEEHFDGMSPLYEIIYPENRIVVDYGALDTLQYLGSVDIDTGKFYPNTDLLVGPAQQTLREVLSMPDRENKEGVIVWLDNVTAVKIKQQDYIELHRIVSSLSQKEVWRQLRAGTYTEFVQKLPDEFYGWADATAAELRIEFNKIEAGVREFVSEVIAQGFETRKDLAIYVTNEARATHKGLIFMAIDEKPMDDAIWKMLEPVGANPMKIIVE